MKSDSRSRQTDLLEVIAILIIMAMIVSWDSHALACLVGIGLISCLVMAGLWKGERS